MKKGKYFQAGLFTAAFVLLSVVSSDAMLISSEPILTDPATTENLWSYSYSDSGYSGSGWYATSSQQYDAVTFKGYVTGAHHPTHPGEWDWFGIASNEHDTTTMHVFETFIESSIDQQVTFSFGGDDGHSLFLDDTFLVGGGFGVWNSTTVDMIAGISYRLTFVGNNNSGSWRWDFTTNTGNGGTALASAANISMDGEGDFAPVPEPATMLLFGTGLVGLVGSRLRKKEK